MKRIETDIELTIARLGMDQHEKLAGKIPGGYEIDDRSSTGYGLALRSISPEKSGDLNERISDFLLPLITAAEMIKGQACILRIAVFNTLATATLSFDPKTLAVLQIYDAKLEITVYPTTPEK